MGVTSSDAIPLAGDYGPVTESFSKAQFVGWSMEI